MYLTIFVVVAKCLSNQIIIVVCMMFALISTINGKLRFFDIMSLLYELSRSSKRLLSVKHLPRLL